MPLRPVNQTRQWIFDCSDIFVREAEWEHRGFATSHQGDGVPSLNHNRRVAFPVWCFQRGHSLSSAVSDGVHTTMHSFSLASQY